MTKKFLTILIAVLSLAGIALFLLVASADEEERAKLTEAVSNLVDFSFILLVVAVLTAVITSLLGLFKKPGAFKKALIGLLGLGGILLISYLVAKPDEVINSAGTKVIAITNSSVSKLTSTGIWASLILLLLGGFFFIFDLLKGLIK